MDLSKGRAVIEVIDGRKYEMLIIPPRFPMYRSMTAGVTPQNWASHFLDKTDPYPSFYGEEETAHYYKQKFGHGMVMAFETIGETKLLVLSNYDNIANLECHLGKLCKGKTTRQTKGTGNFLDALRLAISTNMTCYQQSRALQDRDITYPMRAEIPDVPRGLKRCSVYDVDLEMVKGICEFFQSVGCAGYIADELPSAFGARAPVFHREIALCFAPKVIRPIVSDGSSSSVSDLDSSIPQLMRKKSAKFYRAMLEKDAAFRNIVDVNSRVGNIITNFIGQYNDLLGDRELYKHYRFCIGGGFAWSYWVTTMNPAPKLSATEMKMFQSGYGINLYYMTSNRAEHGKLICNIYKTFEAIKKALDGIDTFHAYDIELVTHGVHLRKTKDGVKCISDENEQGKSLAIVLRKRDMGGQTVGVNYTPYDGMEILRVDDVLFENVDINTFFTRYVATSSPLFPLLTAEGLWTLQLVYPNYSDSWFLTYYRSIYIKYLMSLKTSALFEDLAERYDNVFGKSLLYDKDSYYDLKVRSIRIQEPELDAVISSVFDQWIMKLMRPYINQCIVNMDQEIAAATGGAAKVFIAGGDSMRRYKKNISTTSDIDSKIYLPAGAPKAMFDAVHDIVQRRMMGLVTFLIRQKADVFPKGMETIHVKNDTSIPWIQFISHDHNNLQFRLRYNEPNSRIPVDLYSIDYRAYIVVPTSQRPVKIRYHIALLDVVIAPYSEKVVPDAILERFGPSQIPVASLPFLIHDLKHTYENPELAGARYLKNKKNKDMSRYMELKGIAAKRAMGAANSPSGSSPKQTHPSHTVNIYETRAELNATVPFADDPIEIEAYKTIFTQIMQRNKKIKSLKHIVPFDGGIIRWHTSRRLVHESTSASHTVHTKKMRQSEKMMT
jgi:hypothetical protein